MINYKYAEIKCPKCGKSHFKVRQHNTDMGFDIIPAVFTYHPDPIYKDGVLQNPEPVEPAIERFQCMECGCNFRTETYPVIGDVAVYPNIINEDEEEGFFEKIIREHNEEVKKQQEIQAETIGAKIGDANIKDITGITNLEAGKGILTYKSDEPTISYALDDAPLFEEIKSKVNDMWGRLEKVEERLYSKIEK